MTRWLGVDVGGANLKVADTNRFASSQPFELWRYSDKLSDALVELFAAAPPFDALAATMTGELADCYPTKREGVLHITAALARAAGGRPLRLYCVDGGFRDLETLPAAPLLAAASNWHALARYAARWLPQHTGMVVDVGSTTTDIVAVVEGQAATESRTDTARLLTGELVYTGTGRTPICAVTKRLPYRGAMCPVAAEMFATTADVYRLLDGIASGEGTADGRSLSEQHCVDRIARQVCTDREQFKLTDALEVCQHVRQLQAGELTEAMERVAARVGNRPVNLMVSGSGEGLARLAAERCTEIAGVSRLSDEIGVAGSSAAAAAAVAYLAQGEAA